MIELEELLGKFKKILLQGESGKALIQKALVEVVGIEVKTKEMEIKNGALYLDIKPIYKNEVLFKKELVLNKIKEIGGPKIENIH